MQDIFSEMHTDPKKDLPTKRKLEVLTENDFVITQGGPYGFWSVSRERGQIPEELSGKYTTPERAKLAVTTYLAKKQ